MKKTKDTNPITQEENPSASLLEEEAQEITRPD